MQFVDDFGKKKKKNFKQIQKVPFIVQFFLLGELLIFLYKYLLN